MLESLITSKTRIKLLLKFFLNPETKAYLRSLAEEFGESSNAVRIELNRMHDAGLLDSESNGRTKVYYANKKNPLYQEIHNLVRKYLGIDIVENVIDKLGNVKSAFIIGDYAKGNDSGIIDLVVVGNIRRNYLNELVVLAEQNMKRKIRTLVFNEDEFEQYKKSLKIDKAVLLWSNKENV